MKHAPNVDLIVPLDMEDQVGEPAQRRASKFRQIQFVRISRRSARGITCDMPVGALKGIDEIKRALFAEHCPAIVEGALHIGVCRGAKNDRFIRHIGCDRARTRKASK